MVIYGLAALRMLGCGDHFYTERHLQSRAEGYFEMVQN